MKIYNEIVIDMNPESSSYGETLHEDSFEYEGKLALLKEWKTYDPWYGQDGSEYYYEMEWGGGIDNIKHIRMYKDGALVYDDANNTQAKWARETIDKKFAEQSGGGQKFGSAEEGTSFKEAGFTATEGEFDPTSEEFRKSVEETGGMEQVIKGYGWDPEDFDPYYEKPLDFIETGKKLDLDAIAETKRAGGVSYDIAGKAAQERLRSAKKGYGLGMEAAGLQVGRSLFDVKQQTEKQLALSGFATQGTVTGIAQRAQKGVFGDYTMQQKQLAETLAGAQTTFGISQLEIAEGRKSLAETARLGGEQAELTYDIGVEDFWKETEEELYGRASTLGL